MSDIERLRAAFRTALSLDDDYDVDSLEYRSIEKWDSLAHMALIAAIEDEFDIMIDTDDVIDMSSFAKAGEILGRTVSPSPPESRVALVTGSSRGIGARSHPASPPRVRSGGSREQSTGRPWPPTWPSASGRRRSRVGGNVTHPAAVKAMSAVFEKHRRLDALVVNAGVHDAGLLGMSADEATAAAVRRQRRRSRTHPRAQRSAAPTRAPARRGAGRLGHGPGRRSRPGRSTRRPRPP